MVALLRTMSLRQLSRHPARLGLMVLSVALGVAAWTTTQALDRALGAALRTAGAPMAGTADFYVSRGDLGVPRSLIERLAVVPKVKAVRPLIVKRALLTGPIRRPVTLVGVDLAAERGRASAAGLTIRGAKPADLARSVLAGRCPVVVGEALEGELPGPNTPLDVLISGTPRCLAGVGVIEARGPGAALGGHVLLGEIGAVARLVGQPNRVTRLDVALSPGADHDTVRASLTAAVDGQADVVSPAAQDDRVQDALASLRAGFALCGAGALLLALVLSAGVFGVGVAERRAEVGLLRALGADRGQVARLFLAEAASLGMIGALAGLPLGWALGRLTCDPLLRVVGDVFLPLEPVVLGFDVASGAIAILAGIATTVLAALAPTIHAALMAPLSGLARVPVGGRYHGRGLTLDLAAATVAVLIAILIASTDAAGPRVRVFAPLGCILAATALVIPTVTAFAARTLCPVAEACLGLPGRLAADRLARHPAGSGVAIVALAGGMALIFQTGGVIEGNEQAVGGWVDSCIAGDLFITSGGPLSASGQTLPMRDEVETQIERAIPGAHAVGMSFRYVSLSRSGKDSRVLVLAVDAGKYYQMYEHRQPPLADVALYRRLAAPGTALVSENFATLYGVAVGDTIVLPGTSGTVRLEVVGTVADYSCSRGVVMVDRSGTGTDFGVAGTDVLSVTIAAGSDPDRLARTLAQLPWAAEQALVVVSRGTVRAHILGMVGRLYGVAYVQEIAAGLVSALGVATALLISALQRRRELGLLRAAGATPAQAVCVLLAEAGLMAVIGIAIGLLIGVFLEWYVLRVVLLVETGFAFPVRIPWVHALVVAMLTLTCALLAGLTPAIRAARERIPEALACE